MAHRTDAVTDDRGGAAALAILLVLDARDNVAVALEGLESGSVVPFAGGTLVVRDAVPMGHKVAVRPIAAGTSVLKYGAVIGRATVDIAQGCHVHIHNVEGLRGRGDRAGGGV